MSAIITSAPRPSPDPWTLAVHLVLDGISYDRLMPLHLLCLLSTNFALMSASQKKICYLALADLWQTTFKCIQTVSGKVSIGIWGLKLFRVRIFYALLQWKSPVKEDNFVWKCWWRRWCLSEKRPGQLHITLGCIVVYFSILLNLHLYY